MGGSKELEEGKVVEGLATDGTGGNRIGGYKTKGSYVMERGNQKMQSFGMQ